MSEIDYTITRAFTVETHLSTDKPTYADGRIAGVFPFTMRIPGTTYVAHVKRDIVTGEIVKDTRSADREYWISVTHNKIELEYCADKEPALFGEFYYFPIVKAAPHDIEFNGYLFMGVIPTIWHSDTKTGIAVASYYVKKDEK